MKKLLSILISTVLLITSIFYMQTVCFASNYLPNTKDAVELNLDETKEVIFRYSKTDILDENVAFVKFTPNQNGNYELKISPLNYKMDSTLKAEQRNIELSAYDSEKSAGDYVSLNENPETAELIGYGGNSKDNCFVYTFNGGNTYYYFIRVPKKSDCSDINLSITISKHIHVFKNYLKPAGIETAGRRSEKCNGCLNERNIVKIPAIKTISLSSIIYTYDGKSHTPAVTVKDSTGKALVRNKDYKLTYSSGRKAVGRYCVKVSLMGSYAGSKTIYFTIKPKGTSISKINKRKKGFTVIWKTQKTQTDGYQVQYSTSSNFTNPKTITLKKNTNYAKKITNLKGKKKYYVRVRTYKTVTFKGEPLKIYSGWSKAKAVTTK